MNLGAISGIILSNKSGNYINNQESTKMAWQTISPLPSTEKYFKSKEEYKKDCEQFWQGDFGNDYTARNINLVENNYQMFSKIFYKYTECDGFNHIINDIKSICEFGSGSGMNIQALQRIFPGAEYYAVEINNTAYNELNKLNNIKTYNKSIFDDNMYYNADLVLSKGLLIHIHPDNIQKAYEVLYNASNKYILLAEYYSPERREIVYRGEHNKLWAFNFWGEFQSKYSDLKVVDYMFISKYDKYPQDDITAVLFEKVK